MIFREKIFISKGEAERINALLTKEPKDEGEWFSDREPAIIYSVRFVNGFIADVKLCGTSTFEPDGNNTPWTEAVLFKPSYENGIKCLNEVACSDVSDEFFGLWEIEYGDDLYIVNVVENNDEPMRVVSEEVYSPQSYLEAMTGEYYITPKTDNINDVEFIENILDDYFDGQYWSHCLSDISETHGPVVLVSCLVDDINTGKTKTVYRWFEVDENNIRKYEEENK